MSPAPARNGGEVKLTVKLILKRNCFSCFIKQKIQAESSNKSTGLLILPTTNSGDTLKSAENTLKPAKVSPSSHQDLHLKDRIMRAEASIVCRTQSSSEPAPLSLHCLFLAVDPTRRLWCREHSSHPFNSFVAYVWLFLLWSLVEDVKKPKLDNPMYISCNEHINA
ncbi:hypothetical protein RSAG8_09039, partial [Rhizoctonia solani AG-8 WAC10335]